MAEVSGLAASKRMHTVHLFYVNPEELPQITIDGLKYLHDGEHTEVVQGKLCKVNGDPKN
jgi:hypothetical protein